MATDYQALIIPIGLDVSQFDKSINDVMAGFKKISKEIKDIPADKLTEETKKTYQELKRTVELLQSNAFDLPGDKLADSSKKARTSLTNLNLIVQDLPFGFIGIQNNIPGLVNSFNGLAAEAGGTGGAFKALVGQLKGPGGAFLAFTAITSVVTFLTKEYGSLGNAIDELIGNEVNPLTKKIEELDKAFKDYTKDLKSNQDISELAKSTNAGLIQTVFQLAKGATDLSSSEQERGKYLEKLKEIDKTYFGNLTTGESAVNAINEATKKYTESLLAQSTVKAYQSQLDAIEAQIAPLSVLNDELKANLEIAKVQDKLNSKIIAQAAKLGGGAAPNLGDPIGNANKALDENAAKIEKLYIQREKFINGLSTAIDVWKNFKYAADEATESNEKFSYSFKSIKDYYDFDTSIKRVVDLANVVLDLKAKESDRANALKALKQEDANFFQGLSINKSGYESLTNAIDLYLQKLDLLNINSLAAKKASDLQAQADKNTQAAIEARTKAEQELLDTLIERSMANDKIGNSTDKIVQKNNAYLNQLSQQQRLSEFLNKSVQYWSEQNGKALLKLSEQFTQFKSNLFSDVESVVGQFSGIFDEFLETGKVTFETFKSVVLSIVKSLVTKLIATGITELLVSLLNPEGAAAEKSVGLVKSVLKNFTNPGAYLGLGRVAAPSFSGIGGSPLTMGGQVNLMLRGSDLIGAINRTNSTISRVG